MSHYRFNGFTVSTMRNFTEGGITLKSNAATYIHAIRQAILLNRKDAADCLRAMRRERKAGGAA